MRYLQERLNSNGIAMCTAVSLCYLQTKEQKIIEKLLADGIKVAHLECDVHDILELVPEKELRCTKFENQPPKD